MFVAPIARMSRAPRAPASMLILTSLLVAPGASAGESLGTLALGEKDPEEGRGSPAD
jgi:hypothetical protein